MALEHRLLLKGKRPYIENMLGPKGERGRGRRRKLRNEELHNCTLNLKICFIIHRPDFITTTFRRLESVSVFR